jgi:hypothetical protein
MIHKRWSRYQFTGFRGRPPRLPLGLHGPSTIPKVATVSVHAEHCAPLSFRHGFRRSQIMTDERPDLPPEREARNCR